MKQRLLNWVFCLFLGFGLGGCKWARENVRIRPVPTTVKLLDGTVLEGKTRVNIYDVRFKFRDNKTGKRSKIFNSNVKSISQYFPTKPLHFERIQFKINNKNEEMTYTILASYLVRGELSLLYSKTATESWRTANGKSVPSASLLSYYYLKKKDEMPVRAVYTKANKGQSKDEKFITLVGDFFSDAPEIMSKLGQDGYRFYDLKKMVEEYNQLKSKR